MNLFKKYKGNLKRITAFVLGSAMIATGVPGFGAMEAKAAVLENNAFLMNANTDTLNNGVGNYTFGSSNNTSYAFGVQRNGTSNITNSYVGNNDVSFNIAFNVPTEGNSGYGDNRTPNETVNYGDNWFPTFYSFKSPDEGALKLKFDANNMVELDSNGHPVSTGGPSNLKHLPNRKNGQVIELSNGESGAANRVIELRQSIMPSFDNEYVIVEYTVRNTHSDKSVDFMVGSESDTELSNQDSSPILVTEHTGNSGKYEGLHYHATIDSILSTFDVITNLPSNPTNDRYALGMKKSSDSDPSRVMLWAGNYQLTNGKNHQLYAFSSLTPALLQSGDSAAGFSAYFQLEPNEQKTARFALALKKYVYYVHGGKNNGNFVINNGIDYGYMGGPVQAGGTSSKIGSNIVNISGNASSIQRAIDKAKVKKRKEIYIMVQADEEIQETITIPANMTVHLQSADVSTDSTVSKIPSSNRGKMEWNFNTNSIPKADGTKKTLTRAASLNDKPMFIVESGGTLITSNIKLDGNNVESTKPLVLASGKLNIKSETDIMNSKVTEADTASAIEVSAGGKLNLLGGTITGNTSTGTKGAAIVNNSAEKSIKVQGKVFVNANPNLMAGSTTPSTDSDILLKADGDMVMLSDTLEAASDIRIRLDSALLPTKSNEGRQIVDKNGMNYSSNSFSITNTGSTASLGIAGHTVVGGGAQSIDHMYVESTFYTISVQVVDESGSSIPQTSANWDGTTPNPFLVGTLLGNSLSEVPAGKELDWAYPVQLTNGKVFEKLTVAGQSQITGSIYNGLDFNAAGTGTGKKIRGVMPAENLVVTVTFTSQMVEYKFDPDGGAMPFGMGNTAKEPISSGASTLGNLPVPSKAGFVFRGWQRFTDANTNGIFDSGETVTGALLTPGSPYPNPSAEDIIAYRAKWDQDITPYTIQKNYSNISSTLPLSFGSEDGSDFVMNADVTEHSPFIPGYKFSAGSALPVGGNFALNPTTKGGIFTKASMPGTAHDLTYRYAVDPDQSFTFDVKHVTGTGTLPGVELLVLPQTSKKAEQAISASKRDFPGYVFREAKIVQGAANVSAQVLGLNADQGLLTTQNYATDGNLAGFMPNQNVSIVFYYDAASDSSVTRRFLAEGTPVFADRIGAAPLAPFGPLAIPQNASLYGYMYDATRPNAFTHSPSSLALAADASGAISGTMPATGNINVTYDLGKDASKWNHVNFAFVTGSSAFATMTPSTPAPLYVLTDDGVSAGHENAPNLAAIRAMSGFPTVTPDDYHRIDGWYKDAAGTQRIQDTDRLMTDASGSQTIYVKLAEDPDKWVDVRFESSDHTKGSLQSLGANVPGGNPQHLKYDVLWADVVKPGTNPIENYELKNWTTPGGEIAADASRVVSGVYKANFGKKDATWGLVVGAFGATGSIGNDGTGTVTATGITPGNVYVVTDPDGNIVGVATGSSGELNFPGMVPGRTYNVIEGTPDTVAVVGSPASSITGSNVSSPKPVTIPAIGDNKSVGVDPANPERAQIVINPADPEAEYALVDSNGNVVPYPDSNGGWLTPTGSDSATVTFRDLDPGETYTVVARKKGNPSETPLGNLEAGVPVVANPGSMVEAKNYIIETKTNGINADVKVITVAGESVNSTSYDQAKANSAFSIHADATDSAGNPFLYWMIMNGRIPGVSGKITNADYSGQIARGNVVFKAVYDVKPRNAAGEMIAPAEQANRGNAAEGEFALDPEQIAQLEDALSNSTDVSLINVNGADVRYKVIFDKRATKTAESDLIKQEPSQVWARFPEAFTTAWSLDIKEERYVDGRLVQNASPSNAAIKVSVQLEAQDTDMLDYEIWDLGAYVDNSWNPVTPTLISQVVFAKDAANNAGYLSFDGNLNHTYVLVYAKTFKLHFIDNNPTLDHRYLGDTNRNFFKEIKVRKKDAVTSSDYASDYVDVTDYADRDMPHGLETPFDDVYGVTHTYVNWSKKEMPANFNVFDPDSEVTKTQNVFAYYNNNRTDVTQARTDLTNLIPVAVNLRSNPYLKLADLDELNAEIAKAQNVLDRVRGRMEDGVDPLRMANYPELRAAIEALQRVIDRINGTIHDRNEEYIRRTGGSSGGGTGSSGRGGGGASRTPLEGTKYKDLPLSADRQNTFTLGVDGHWKINPMTGRWSFELNGGLPLNDKWARIDYVDSTGTQITDWYRFDLKSSLITGWHYDNEYKGWYFLNPNDGKDLGKMVRGWHKEEATNKWYYLNKDWGSMATGWHLDPDDGRWYYLDPDTGEMAVGWHFINGQWYFFNTGNSAPTWSLVDGNWVYGHSNIRPFGSLYMNETTPDGYRVNAGGAWIR